MFKNIKKRNGKSEKFDVKKIINAIVRAGEESKEIKRKEAKELSLRILSMAGDLFQDTIPDVEEIQDIVERVLLDSPFHKTSKAYILYREQHTQIRNIATKVNVDLVDNYIGNLDWKIKENSNMCYSLQGLNNYISSDITSEYWLNKIYPEPIRNAHKSGDFHIHDLNLLAVYCVGWDLPDLIKVGFKGVSGKIESSPPKHLRSALGQVVNFFYTLQGEAAGAQALSNFDTLLAPFIRYDNLSYDEVKQALQEFLFNMNIPTRVGFQTPFTNITMDLNIPSMFKDQPVVIGGVEQKETYGEFKKEVNLFNKAFAEIMIEGDSKGRVFTFPIPTYNITKDFDWDNVDFDIIWKMTGKYGIPYFSNFVNSDMTPEDARSMCCRLRLDNRELLKRGGSLFGSNPLTGSIGVVTINLPRIGFKTKNKNEFLQSLKEKVYLAANSLILKRKVLEQFTEENLYPYSKFYLRSVKERFGNYWQNHFSTIGILGMNEACINLFNESITSENGKQFSIEVMDFLRDLMVKLQRKTNDLFNLEATPGEGTTYRLALLDKKYNQEIVCANQEEYEKGSEPYYTNSSQVPVNYSDDVFEILELQDELQSKYTGGTVLNIFLGEKISDTDIVKKLVKKITDNFKLPYFTLTPTFSICPTHGYLKGQQPICPQCNSETEVYSRVVGYLRPVNQWNEGKREEFKMRKTFNIRKENEDDS